MRSLALLALAALLAGCLGEDPWLGCGGDVTVATPRVGGAYMQTAPGVPWQTVVLAGSSNVSAAAATAMAWSASAGWNATGQGLSGPGEPAFQVASVSPGVAGGQVRMDYELRTRDAGCEGHDSGSVAWDLMAPREGAMARPGQGVHVMTAGFFENGTLFYTNIPEVEADERWPRWSEYGWEGDAPLPVYVYDQDRSEQPAHWRGATGTLAQARGSPLEPLVPLASPYAAEADGRTGLGYFTTIEGFNAALRESPTTTTRVVRLAPEQAYTVPGYEGHALYGEALVFYIKVLDVVDAPCPPGVAAWSCLPEPMASPGAPGITVK